MKNLSKYFLIFTTTLTAILALPAKRQAPDNPDTRPTVNDRYGFLGGFPGMFSQPFNPNNFGFNIFGSNPFFSQFFPQNQFYPQPQPLGNSISQAPARNQNQQFQPQNQQFQPQNQQFQPQNQQFQPQNTQFQPQNQQNQPQIPQNQPQQNQQFQPQNQQQQQVVSTTVSPQVQACIDSCIESTAGQYNPVCGSDNRTYHNQERLDCTTECGRSVRAIHRGACARPTIPSWQQQG